MNNKMNSAAILLISLILALIVQDAHAAPFKVTSTAQCKAAAGITKDQCSQMIPQCKALGIGMKWVGPKPCGKGTGGCLCVGNCDYLSKCGANACKKVGHCSWVPSTKKCVSTIPLQPMGSFGECPSQILPSTPSPTMLPTKTPTDKPTAKPTNEPTIKPTSAAPTTKAPTTKAPTNAPTHMLATFLYKSKITVNGAYGVAQMLQHCADNIPEQCLSLDPSVKTCVTPYVSATQSLLGLVSLTTSPLKNALQGLWAGSKDKCTIKSNLPILSAVNGAVIRNAGATGVSLNINLNLANLFSSTEDYWLGGKYDPTGLFDITGLGVGCQNLLSGSTSFTTDSVLSLGIAASSSAKVLTVLSGGLKPVTCDTQLPFLCACQRAA